MRRRTLILRLLVICFLLPSALAQRRTRRPAPRRGPEYMQKLKSYDETQYVAKAVLRNGLTVIVNEFRVHPVVAVTTCVRAGHIDEPEASPGIAHVLERMLFRGTEKRKDGAIAKDTGTLGGTLQTSAEHGCTLFDTVVPSAQWKKALEIQADALQNAALDAEDLKRELRVIAGESRQELDDPDLRARAQLLEIAFAGHRMARRPAGTDASLRGLTRERLLEYYRRAYVPARTVVVISGDVTTPEVLTEAVRVYTQTSAGTQAPPGPPEPSQTQLRYAEVRADIPDPQVLIGFHTGPESSPDYAALEVLNAIIGAGEASMLSDRVKYQKELVSRVSSELISYPGGGYLVVQADTTAADIDKAELAVLAELELLKRKPPEPEYMEQAFAQLERRYWSRLQTARGRAHALAHFEALGDWKKMNEWVARIRNVAPAEVSAAAGKYLRLQNCSLVELMPAGAEPRNITADAVFKTLDALIEPTAAEELAERERETQPEIRVPDPGKFTFSEVRYPIRLASVLRGPDLFIREDHSSPLVQVGFFYPGGQLLEKKENAGVTLLMLNSMLRGAGQRVARQLNRQLAVYGADVTPVVADDYFGFRFSILSRNVEAGLDLIGDIIKTPRLDPDDFARVKEIQSAASKRRRNSGPYVQQLLERALFGDFGYALPPQGTEESLGKLDALAIQNWYTQHVRRGKPIVVLIGDTQGTSLAAFFVKQFSGSRFQNPKLPEDVPKALDGKAVAEEKTAHSQSLVALGFQAPPLGDEDEFVAVVLHHYLAGEGGRIVEQLRDREGLAGSVAMRYQPRLRAGLIGVSLATDPGDEDKALKLVEAELRGAYENPIPYRDYRTAINSAMGWHTIAQQDRFAQIAAVVSNHLAGQGLDAIQDFVSEVQLVRQEDLAELARRLFRPERSATVLLHGAAPAAQDDRQ